jgi:hypothetical protein
LLQLQHSFFLVLGSSVGDVVWVVGDGDGVGVTGGAVGGSVDGCHDAPMSGKSLVGSLGGWYWYWSTFSILVHHMNQHGIQFTLMNIIVYYKTEKDHVC